MRKELKIISLSEIKTEEVKWLWYPYIPFGKVTIVQGDPGEGKTTFVLAVIAALTRGEALSECETGLPPMNVIYQTAEDGLADTIKPRLEAVGADCTHVQTIDDSKSMWTRHTTIKICFFTPRCETWRGFPPPTPRNPRICCSSAGISTRSPTAVAWYLPRARPSQIP